MKEGDLADEFGHTTRRISAFRGATRASVHLHAFHRREGRPNLGALDRTFRILLNQPAEFPFYGADFLNRGEREHRQSLHHVLWRSQMFHDFANISMKIRNFPRF
jgi:hypothetical protein